MPDLHDLAPVVDADAAWHIFTNAARRRRTRRRLATVLATVVVVIAAVGIAHFATQGGSSARVEIVGQPTVPHPTIPSSRPPESIPLVVPPSQPPESIPQGILNGASMPSIPFPSTEVAVENVWQVLYKGYEVQVYFGAQVMNDGYNTALESPTSQGLAIVAKTPYGSGAGGPAQVTGFRFHTPQKSGALRATSATVTTVTATTPGGAKFTYDVTTGTFTAG